MGRREEIEGEAEPDHWFEPLADHMGRVYLRYSFTKGTEQEVDFLVTELGLKPGMRVLDVGCGPGRHAHALGRRGIKVLGVDISRRFIDIAAEGAPPGVEFVRADARALDYQRQFDAAISLCQGAFGLVGPGADSLVLRGMAKALKRDGRVAVSAFSAYFQVKYPQEHGGFDAATGVQHERMTVKDEDGNDMEADAWTTCYTPRELQLLMTNAGLHVDHIWSVEPGRYQRAEPTVETPEFLAIGRADRSVTRPSTTAQ